MILDDFAYVTRDQAQTSVLFELITARYEHRSLLLTANQPFGKWDTIFPDHAMTVAAVDRLIHRAAILELNVDSYDAAPPCSASAAPMRSRPLTPIRPPQPRRRTSADRRRSLRLLRRCWLAPATPPPRPR